MAVKKSELYSSLWSSCDELRGGMDASQYKDYVLVLLFIKYVSDKYAGVPYAPITVPKGASFHDMAALKGNPAIGDLINKKIVAPLARENHLSDMPDFNDESKLGSGKEKVDRLTNLIAIFENKALDFSKNRADGDDILGDAYEYLMRHFASESGKSKGQFYTPAEVSLVMAKILGIGRSKTSPSTTVYDPTCGSGSLLLKVSYEASTDVTLYGQEKDSATSSLARMNMILHNNPTAEIRQGNTLTTPHFKEKDTLKTFDYVVANPPFSDKRWSNGLHPEDDEYQRFQPFGIPPSKQGDFAYLLHIVRSLKSNGEGGCVLPHGVLFRGNAEAEIRRNLIRKGYIKGIIGLPANLFYGTGIPACIVVIDKKGAAQRKGVFMVDAGRGFMKDGPKNRLRSQDIHKIVDSFTKFEDIHGYSRMVSFSEIEDNDFNLNIPRYIDSQEREDIQNIEAHLVGGIPNSDIDELNEYWLACPSLKKALFKKARKGFSALNVQKDTLKRAIGENSDFARFVHDGADHFDAWEKQKSKELKKLVAGFFPKDIALEISEDLLKHYSCRPLVVAYDVYQHFMNYWAEVMQDDCYQISMDGWKAETYRLLKKDKSGKEKDVGWTCDLVPKDLLVSRFFVNEQANIDALSATVERIAEEISTLEEENNAEGGALQDVSSQKDGQIAFEEAAELVWKEIDDAEYAQYSKILTAIENAEKKQAKLVQNEFFEKLKNKKGVVTQKAVNDCLAGSSSGDNADELQQWLENDKQLKGCQKQKRSLWSHWEQELDTMLKQDDSGELLADVRVVCEWMRLNSEKSDANKLLKKADTELDAKAYAHYKNLTEKDVKSIVVDDKWMATLRERIHSETDRVSHRLTSRVTELAERYETTMPDLEAEVKALSKKVEGHLRKMGLEW